MLELPYNREPVLPLDIKYKLSSTKKIYPDEPFYKNIFDTVSARKKQQRDYESRNKSSTSNDIYIGSEVLLRHNKHKDRKGGKFTFKLLGQYVVSDITKKGLVKSKNKNDKDLKKRD